MAQTKSKKKQRRRRILGCAAIMALAGLTILWTRLPTWSAQATARLLTSYFGRSSTLGRIRFGFFPLRADVFDLRVSGLRPGSEPFLRAQRVTLIPAWRTLLTSSITLSRVVVEGFVMRINTFPEGGDDIPRMKRPTSQGGLNVRIRRLLVRKGEFALNHVRVPVNLDLPEFTARLSTRRDSRLAGRFASNLGWIQFGKAPKLEVATEIDLALSGSRLVIESARVDTQRSQLSFHGELPLTSNPQGVFKLNGLVDLKELDRHMWRTGFGLEGRGQYDGSFSVDGSRVSFQGRLSGTKGVFDGVPVPRFTGLLARDESGVHLREWEIETLDGSARFDLEIPAHRAPVRLSTKYSRVDAESAVRAIFDLGPFAVGAHATGDAELTWPRARKKSISGRVAFDLDVQQISGRTPLSGRFVWSARNGHQRIEYARLRTPSTTLRMTGEIDPQDRLELIVDGGSTDLAASDNLARRLRFVFGNPEAMVAGLSGKGIFSGQCRGTIDRPVFMGRFTGSHVGFLGVDWGSAEWAGVLDAFHVASHSLVVRRGRAEMWLDGDMEMGDYGIRDALDVRLRFEQWPAEDFVRAFKWDADVSGPVTGDAVIRRRRSSPTGIVHIHSRAGRYYGVPYEGLSLTSLLHGRTAEVRDASARVGRGTVRFWGSGTDDEIYDGEAILESVGIEALRAWLPERTAWQGAITGRITLRGAAIRPIVAASFKCPQLMRGKSFVGPLTLDAVGDGSGKIRVGGRVASTQGDLTLTGVVSVVPPFESELILHARNAALDPVLRVVTPAVPENFAIAVDGLLKVQGPLGQPERLNAALEIPTFDLTLSDYGWHASRPVVIGLANGIAELRDVHLEGEDSRISAQGTWAIAGRRATGVAVRVDGVLDMGALESFTEHIRGRGTARLALSFSGPSNRPRMDGTLELDGVGLRFRGFPHGIENVRGTVRLSNATAAFPLLTGRLAGGDVEARGELDFTEGQLRSVDVQATGRRLALRYPEDLKSAIDADLRYYGDAGRQWITGEVTVRQATWTRRYDVARELLAIAPAVPGHESTLREGIHYDVRVHAPGTLRVDNNLATLDARAELQLRGTVDQPVILGRADIVRGRVYFGGNTYIIRRGTIDFANPRQVDPVFEIEAETFARSYRVTLGLSGTVRHVQPVLTSDPPLSSVQILNLLAGADESAVTSLARAQREQPQLGASSAAALATGWLSETVGLERGVQKLRFLGLSRFSIDPKAVNLALAEKSDVNASARLTLGGRLNPDLTGLLGRHFNPNLSWFYVLDLGGQEERFLSLEYIVSDRLSLLFTSSERFGERQELGVDVLLRHAK